MSGRTSLVIADDQGMVRAGFRSLLTAEPDLEVVGEASDGEQAVEVVTRLEPHVTLMDIRMPRLDGIAATRRLVEARVPTRVLVLTTFDLDEYVFEALRAGASGFLLKDAPAEELAAAIRVVAAGESLLAPGVTRRVIDAFVRRAAPASRARDPRLDQLTPRALAVRRALLLACPVLAGLFLVLGAVADPASGISGDRMTKIYIDNPDPLQWKSTGYHWAYAFWIGTALMVAPLVRGRGAWLATVAAVIGFAGMVTLPGMLMSDWYQAGIGHAYGLQGVKHVEDHMLSTMWGIKGFMVVGLPGLALALPLAAAGLWRAGLVRWWSFAATVGAFVVFMVSQATWWGAALSAVLLTVFAASLASATRPSR